MFEIKDIDKPVEIVDCENCGCHSEDVMEIIISPTMIIKGKEFKINNERNLRLCKNCRQKLGKLLITK